jgi:hypothetical protein
LSNVGGGAPLIKANRPQRSLDGLPSSEPAAILLFSFAILAD